LLAANVPFLPPRQMGMQMPVQTTPPPAPPQRAADKVVYSPPVTNVAAAAAPRLADLHCVAHYITLVCFTGHFPSKSGFTGCPLITSAYS